MSLTLPGEGPGDPTCSRSGCTQPASWRLDWRNPRIHAADRTKTWLACDDHRELLAGFLTSRSFPVSVSPFSPTGDRA